MSDNTMILEAFNIAVEAAARIAQLHATCLSELAKEANNATIAETCAEVANRIAKEIEKLKQKI